MYQHALRFPWKLLRHDWNCRPRSFRVGMRCLVWVSSTLCPCTGLHVGSGARQGTGGTGGTGGSGTWGTRPVWGARMIIKHRIERGRRWPLLQSGHFELLCEPWLQSAHYLLYLVCLSQLTANLIKSCRVQFLSSWGVWELGPPFGYGHRREEVSDKSL